MTNESLTVITSNHLCLWQEREMAEIKDTYVCHCARLVDNICRTIKKVKGRSSAVCQLFHLLAEWDICCLFFFPFPLFFLSFFNQSFFLSGSLFLAPPLPILAWICADVNSQSDVEGQSRLTAWQSASKTTQRTSLWKPPKTPGHSPQVTPRNTHYIAQA